MFSSLKDFLVRKLLVKVILGGIDKVLAQLPGNESKTVVGLLVAGIGLVLDKLPNFSDYLQPILDYLKTLPADQITAAGIITLGLGLIHKVAKVGITSAGLKPSVPVVKVAQVITPEEQGK